jgi:protein O-GlcNAc transferase
MMPVPSETELQQLLYLFNQGDYQATEQQARELVARFPEHGFCWKVLGVTLKYQGHTDSSLLPMQKAAELLPDDAEAHSNLGITLMNQGQLSDAVISYRRALDLNPDYLDVHHHLALTLTTLGELSEAESCYQRVLAIKPDHADALYNLGRVLQQQARLDEAEAYYRRVLAIHPELSDVHSNLGWVLQWQNRLAEAETSYRHALSLNPQDVLAYSHLGLMLHSQGRLQEARACYQATLALEPQFAEVHNNLGIVLHKLGLDQQAESCYLQALSIKPDYAEAHNNLGLSLQAQDRLQEAETAYRNALAINPNNSEAYNNLGIIFQERGQLLNAQASYQRALTIKPNDVQVHYNLGVFYQELGHLTEAELRLRHALTLKPDYHEAHSQLLLTMNHNDAYSPAACLAEAQQYGLSVQVATPFNSWLCDPQPERLRVGIVFGDLTQYATDVFLAELLGVLDPDNLEIIAYPTQFKPDDTVSVHFPAWRPLATLSDAEAAQLIHSDGVHILLDLAGHSPHNRLSVFAWQAAPIQVSWLGSLITTGLPQMTYLLGDSYTIPLETADNFSETLWQLPETYRCFALPDLSLEIYPVPTLTANYITFGSLAPLHNINDAVVALWAKILHTIPHARLCLSNPQLSNETNCQLLRQRFAEQGILPEQLWLKAINTKTEQQTVYQHIDIILDTFPDNNDHCLEALWLGVPVITLAGNKLTARRTASMLSNIDLDPWIAENDDDYLAKAVYFAQDIATLDELRTNLRQQLIASPLFDIENFAGQLEAALWSMYHNKNL